MIDLPDPLFREVKATAARQGMLLKDYISEALLDKLAKQPTPAAKPWMKFAGIAAADPEMVAELRRIEQIVDENFGRIEEEVWNDRRYQRPIIPMNDLWIAAIARQHNLPVLSRDTHFDHVAGLTRIGWSTTAP